MQCDVQNNSEAIKAWITHGRELLGSLTCVEIAALRTRLDDGTGDRCNRNDKSNADDVLYGNSSSNIISIRPLSGNHY